MKQLRMYLLVIAAIVAVGFFGCAGSETGGEADAGGDEGVAEVAARECPDGQVFWSEHDVCAPRVDECEAWEVPVVGGGCMAVGPRACPKLWDPDADVDCEPGELLPCPEGFVETEDGIACVPHFDDDCGEMEIPVLGGGCRKVGPGWESLALNIDVPVFAECPPGQLAFAGGGCVQVGPRACPKLWDPDADVDCEVGDILPCPDGWVESEDGMYCHPGYDECGPGERPLVGGGCQRVIPLPEDCPAGPFPEIPEGVADVIYVLADSSCTEGCGAEAAPYPSIQAAVDAAPAGAAVLVGAGTYAEGLTLTKPVHVIGLCASLVEVTGKALVLPDGDSKVMEAGVGIFDTQGVTLSGLRIRSPAAGVAIVGATNVVLNDLDIGESHGVALYIDGESNVEAGGLWIHDTETGSGEMAHGRGVWVGGGANLNAQAVLVEETRKTGIEVKGEGTRLDLIDGVIRKTNPDSNGWYGRGIQAFDSCTVSLTGSMLEENREIGLAVDGSGTDVDVSGSVIRKTLPDENGMDGYGIQAAEGCTVSVAGSLLEENRATGLAVFSSGTEVEVSCSVIRKTMPDENGEFGMGIEAAEGCTVSVTGSLLEENREIGLAVFHSGTAVEVSGSVIRKTMPDENGEFGGGIQASEGCTVSVTGSLLEENRDVGLIVGGSGTEVEVSGTVIRKTMSGENVEFGRGIQARDGCTVSLSGSLLEENREISLAVRGSGTKVEVSGSVIRKTMPGGNGEGGGIGIQAIMGCAVSVTGSLLEENREIGFAVSDSGTEVEVSGSVIRKTMSNENGEGGLGIQASEGCTVSVTGSLLEENRDIGLAVFHSGTEVEVSGSVIRKTMPDNDGMHGEGLTVQRGASGTALWCRIEGNSTAGIAAYGRSESLDPSLVHVESSAVLNTKEGGAGTQGSDYEVFGDGLFAGGGAELQLDSVVVMDNARAGAYYHESAGAISNTVIAGNGSYGLAMESCHQYVDKSDASIFGNVLEAITKSPHGLPVPPPPEAMEAISVPLEPDE